MNDPSPVAAVDAVAHPTVPGRSLTFERRWAASASEQLEHTRLIQQARDTDAAALLRRCCPAAARVLESLSWRALTRLAANAPVEPNDPDSWRSPDAHAQIVLRRHGITALDPTRLTMEAVRALIDGQARADRDAGLDWTRLDVPAAQLEAALRRAHARLPIALEDPAIYAYRDDQRRVLAARLGVPAEQASDLSRWLLAHPDAFELDDLRCWRIASATWLALAAEQLPAVERVERPVGLFLAPAERGEGWQLAPVLSLDGIRLLDSLGGRVEYDLRSAVLPLSAGTDLLERVSPRTLHAGPNEHLDSAAELSQALTRELGAAVSSGVAREKRERWGRLLVRRRPCTGPDGAVGSELVLRVLTIATRAFPRRRVGAAPRDEHPAQPARRWSSAKRCRRRSNANCRCCSQAKPPASCAIRSASGA